MDEEPKKKISASANNWLIIGIALGVTFGIIFDNISLWLPIGVCIGLVGPVWKKRMKNKNNINDKNKE